MESRTNYHVCEVLKQLTRQIYGCASIGIIQEGWYKEQNFEIFQSIGAILNKILVVNQLMIKLVANKVDNYQNISSHVKNKYNFDIDEIWKETENMIEQSNKNINSLLIKNCTIYIRKLLEIQPSDVKLSNLYIDIYNLLGYKSSSIDVNPMLELSLNGLYLGRIMEIELDRLYKGGFKIDKEFLTFLVNERRPDFFKGVIDRCKKRGEVAKDILIL